MSITPLPEHLEKEYQTRLKDPGKQAYYRATNQTPESLRKSFEQRARTESDNKARVSNLLKLSKTEMLSLIDDDTKREELIWLAVSSPELLERWKSFDQR